MERNDRSGQWGETVEEYELLEKVLVKKNQRECHRKQVVFTVLSLLLAGQAEEVCQSACTLCSCTVHICLQSLLLIYQRIRVGSSCATKQSSTTMNVTCARS